VIEPPFMFQSTSHLCPNPTFADFVTHTSVHAFVLDPLQSREQRCFHAIATVHTCTYILYMDRMSLPRHSRRPSKSSTVLSGPSSAMSSDRQAQTTCRYRQGYREDERHTHGIYGLGQSLITVRIWSDDVPSSIYLSQIWLRP
jgi:hypothetical protein